MTASTGATNTINIQSIPTHWLWMGASTGDPNGGGGPPSQTGIQADPSGNFITDENGNIIQPG